MHLLLQKLLRRSYKDGIVALVTSEELEKIGKLGAMKILA